MQSLYQDFVIENDFNTYKGVLEMWAQELELKQVLKREPSVKPWWAITTNYSPVKEEENKSKVKVRVRT